ncbi:uncharacterized protein CLUP02_12593 [Colletotrichum lupini]|uniref:Uncharacterized protein n=1 Tax=Colletotrichum lupini TaxID=145971 RepID=A0A9Q8T0S8_9PEZI|nr:uncharacterized protein CLUP02_12593 [Colletotrichum lupini]UQC87091.1 hypothetical protein CLUP02_12593 [Colletotrichum lupini]
MSSSIKGNPSEFIDCSSGLIYEFPARHLPFRYLCRNYRQCSSFADGKYSLDDLRSWHPQVQHQLAVAGDHITAEEGRIYELDFDPIEYTYSHWPNALFARRLERVSKSGPENVLHIIECRRFQTRPSPLVLLYLYTQERHDDICATSMVSLIMMNLSQSTLAKSQPQGDF